MKKMIAIDGPAATGKSTVAKKLAAYLGYLYIDTGAMYRAVALACMRQNIPWQEEAACTAVAESCQIELRPFPQGGNGSTIFLDGEDVSVAIRTPAVAQGASQVSAIAGVRKVLVEKQRQLAKNGNVVMDGRDIGTVVLPQADCKIFMTASLPCRAKRRYLEMVAKGERVSLAEVTAEMEQRDYRDSHRSCSPLKQAEDAIYIDSTDLSLDEVMVQLLRIIEVA